MTTIRYFFVACVFTFAHIVNDVYSAASSASLEYLSRRLRETKVEIAKSYSRDPLLDPDPSYDIHWNYLWDETLDSDNALITSFANETFVLVNDRVLRVEVEVSESAKLRRVALINQQKAAKFIRSIENKGSLYLLICPEDGSCSLYVGPNINELRHLQKIKPRGLLMDAEFFTQMNQLYLIVADNSGQFSVPSTIYHWTGTYMDEIAKITTVGAISVTTFNYKQSTIIIFARNVRGQPQIGSEVFKFRNGFVEKIQFVPTDGPTSIHYYEHGKKMFLLVINELGVSRVFWWDGKELLEWMELSEIKSPTKVEIVYVDGQTLLLVCQQNIFSLYKIMDLAYTKLDLLEMKDGYMITDFNAQVNGKSIILVLVKKSTKNLCRIESYKLVIKKFPRESIDRPNSALQYLTRLDDLLKNRMPIINQAYKSWPALFPSSKHIITSSLSKFDKLIIDSGSISEISIHSPTDILTPTELASGLEQSNLDADSFLSQLNKTLFINEIAEFKGTVIIKGDAFFDEMHVDSLNVSTLNEQNVELNHVFSYTKDQEFSEPLQGNIITIENLAINSICGISFENWLLTENTDQTLVELFSDNVNIHEDTILVRHDISLGNLGVSQLHGLNVQKFLNDLFVIGSNQEIKGSVFYKHGLNAHNLTINVISGINATQLLTKSSEQQLKADFFVKTLEIDDLFVSTINNVTVNEAAKISQENIILGKVTFRNLLVTDELAVDDVSVRFDLRPIQIYSKVEINGDLTIRDLILISTSSLYLNGYKLDIDHLFRNYWTKSTDQMIPNNIILSQGITIDDLHSNYLNGYKEDDFLYTTMIEIPEKFGKIHFKMLEIDGVVHIEGKTFPTEYIIAVNDHIEVNHKIQIRNLTVGNLNAQNYNKIPLEHIASGRIGIKVPGSIKYKNLVTNSCKIGELLVKFVNNQDLSSFFEDVLYVNENYKIDYLELKKFEINNFEVEEMNGLKMIEFYRMLMYKDMSAIKNLTIDGILRVNGNLRVDFINDLESADFLKKLSNDDIMVEEQLILDRFNVFGDLSVNLLHGIKLEDIVANTLSKTKSQNITGQFSFQKVQANQLIGQVINGVNVTSLKLISDPLIIEEDATFFELFVKGDITTGFLNNLDIDETYNNALTVPFAHITKLMMNGSIFWENSSTELKSLSNLLNNAVTQNTNQTITGVVTFASSIPVLHLTSPTVIGGIDISSIVLDAVIPIGRTMEITGQKYLRNGLTVRKLRVPENIDIITINGWDILKLNSSAVRKFDEQIITENTIFLKDVTIEKLEVTGKVHRLNTQGIATVNDTLPDNTRFIDLEIQNELLVDNFNWINFEEFMKNRVTLSGNHDVYGDILFRNPIVIAQNASVNYINKIEVANIVLSDSENIQLISGDKIFLKDFGVHGNVNVDLINSISLTEEYKNGIFNNEDTHIDGNIIFSADFETLSNVSVLGSVNGINLDEVFSEISVEAKTIIKNLENDQSFIDSIIIRSSNVTKFMPNVFFYFDIQPELIIDVPNIRKIQTLTTESMVKLNLYGSEHGSNCGLPDNCLCPTQYVAELLDYECKIWKVSGSRTSYNFHDPESRFGLNIVSNSTSSGSLCTQESSSSEVTSISWMLPVELNIGHASGKVTNRTLNIITGYVSDAKTFRIGAKIYVVLAIYYDRSLKSHNVNSLVYQIDLFGDDIGLVQVIPTSGAIALEVFETELHGTHLLIACRHNPTESQLYRFNMRISKFELLRTFWTGGSLNVKSLIQKEESFILLDDPLTNSVHIFNYNIEFDNYHFYQSIFYQSAVKNIEVFYSKEFGVSDAYVIVTTEEGRIFVYEYMFFGRFQLRIQQWLDGVQIMAPFYYSEQRYIFTGTSTNSTIYRIVQQGPINDL